MRNTKYRVPLRAVNQFSLIKDIPPFAGGGMSNSECCITKRKDGTCVNLLAGFDANRDSDENTIKSGTISCRVLVEDHVTF